MLKTFLGTLILVSTVFGSMTYRQELENLSPAQYAVLLHSLESGKSDDLGLTLAAIAWKESSFGKNKINTNDGRHGSYGSHQVLLTSAAGYLKANNLVSVSLDNNVAQKRILINALVNNERISIRFALEELKYWAKRHNGDYRKMVASYNAGNLGIKSPAGKKYAADVAYRVRVLKEFLASN